ncbi:MAG: T9SS type A sorting domain-containing protein [Flavobacterium sp.]|uniref:T9SS type A sorting domain-containing protein n=1 Tax=Flavobacterium sp. TaxID=239 RepID=UPI003BBFD346
MFKKLLLFSVLCIGMIPNAQNIVSGEYFFDTYKDLGQGTSFSIVPDNIVNKTLSISTNNLSSGMHNLFVRVKDDNNTWSLVENKLFYIMPSLSNQGNLIACEWFIDTDPGLGNGTITNFSTPVATISMPLSISATNLSSGLHRLYVRVKDDSNIWSIVECKLFYIMPAATSQPNLIAGEWFVDTDPGVGNGTVISFAEGAVINKTFGISDTNFSVGTHKLFVRVKDGNGVWSFYEVKEFTVTPSSPPPPPTASAQSLCKSSTVANLVATGSNLKWYSAATGGSALATTTLLTTKTYYVSQSAGAFESTRTSVPVTIVALPTTPGTISGAVAQGALVGTSTTVTYSIAAVSGASSYFWTAPTGVNIVSGQGTTSIEVNFQNVAAGPGNIGNLMVQSVNDIGCKSVAKTVTLTKALPTAPSSLTLTNGVTTTAITNISKYMGTNTVLKLTSGTVATATSYEWELPTGVNRTDGSGTNSTLPYIYVNLLGVTSANTFNYSTTAGVSTNVLRIGVKSKNGVGVSISNNASLINPTAVSTARLLTLTAIAPAAPAAVKLTNDAISTSTAVTVISKYLGTDTPLKLSATASTLASSYEWELPSWVNVVSGNSSYDRELIVNFKGNATNAAPAGVTSYYIGAKAKNGIGYSVSNNATLVPATTSTAKLLKVTTSLPTAVTTVTGQIASLCGGNTYNYTMTTSALANSYLITAPTGAVVKSVSNSTNATNILETSDLSFTVTYPIGFTVTTTTAVANKTITITSVNGVGNSATNKVLTLTTALAAVGTNTNSYSYLVPSTGLASAGYFTKCNTQTITVPAVPYATSYVWTLQNGATGSSDTNAIVINFSAVATLVTSTKNIVKVKAYNGCTYSTEKSISLIWDGITVCETAKMEDPTITSTFSVYPNPTSSLLFFESSNNSKIDNLIVMDLLGKVIFEGKPEDNQLNVERFASGAYIIHAFSGKEKFTKKFIKE